MCRWFKSTIQNEKTQRRLRQLKVNDVIPDTQVNLECSELARQRALCISLHGVASATLLPARQTVKRMQKH